MWGLTVDTITGFDAVLANGTVVEKVTKDSEPDLYWVSSCSSISSWSFFASALNR